MNDRRSVVLVQTALPDYREGFLAELELRLGPALRILAGDGHFDPTVRTSVALPMNVGHVRNVFLLRRKLLWQHGAFRSGVAAHVAILEMNPRILSVWATLATRWLLRRRTVLWGHAWPRRGRESPTEALRRPMRRLADAIVVYTATEADELRSRVSRGSFIAAPNALYRAADIVALPAPHELTSFVYVGRLVQSKKPGLLLRAFALIADKAPASRLFVIGEGPLRPSLEDLAGRLAISDRVVFVGHVSARQELARYYASAVASVSPGYVGLSATQSFSFGVPMIIADSEPHAPEIEAARAGCNAVFFRSDDVSALATALAQTYADRHRWLVDRPMIAMKCRDAYSVERMVDGFMTACFDTFPPKTVGHVSDCADSRGSLSAPGDV